MWLKESPNTIQEEDAENISIIYVDGLKWESDDIQIDDKSIKIELKHWKNYLKTIFNIQL